LASASALVLAGTAQAADLPYKAPPPPDLAPSWAGFYLGIDGGMTRHEGSFDDLSADPNDGACCAVAGRGLPLTYSVGKTGGIAGGYAGYNWQQSNFVYGVEAGISWVGANAQQNWDVPYALSAAYQQSQNINWLATFRARAGVVNFASTLLYVTGGLAVAQINDSFNVACSVGGCVPVGTVVDTFSESRTALGWTVGAGAEHMLDPHWTLRGEVNYVGLGSNTVPCTVLIVTARYCSSTTNGIALVPYRGTFSNSLLSGVVGLGYKF
jgi:outer membrane immunogenic protein